MELNKANVSDFFQTLSSAFDKGVAVAKPQLRGLVSRDVPSAGDQNKYAWGGLDHSMREWVGDRHVKNPNSHNWAIVNKTYEWTMGVSRETFEDDSYGIYAIRAEDGGYAASVHSEKLIADLLVDSFSTACYDGQYMIDSDHPDAEGGTQSNIVAGGAGTPWFLVDASKPMRPIIFQPRRDYKFREIAGLDSEHCNKKNELLYGVDARIGAGYGLWQLIAGSLNTLDSTNFNTMRTQMMNLHSDENSDEKLGVMPTHLICAPANESAARTLLLAQYGSGGADNIWYNAVKLIVDPRLS